MTGQVLLLAWVLSCPMPRLTNSSGEAITEFDLSKLKSATERCQLHYPSAPCLKKFEKVEYHTYRATCGAIVQFGMSR